MKESDIGRIAEEAAEPFRKECETPRGKLGLSSGIDPSFKAGFYEGLNVMRRAVEQALREGK